MARWGDCIGIAVTLGLLWGVPAYLWATKHRPTSAEKKEMSDAICYEAPLCCGRALNALSDKPHSVGRMSPRLERQLYCTDKHLAKMKADMAALRRRLGWPEYAFEEGWRDWRPGDFDPAEEVGAAGGRY